MQSGAVVLVFTKRNFVDISEKKGIAFQQLMTDQSLQRRRSSSMNVGQGLVRVISLHVDVKDDSVKCQ